MATFKQRYQQIVIDGRWHVDEYFLFMVVLMLSTRWIVDLPDDDWGIFYPHMPFGGLLDMILLLCFALLMSLTLGTGASWAHRKLKRFAGFLLRSAARLR